MNDSGGRRPWPRRFPGDATGQSETVGVLLLLAITLIGSTAVVALGGGVISETEQSADLQRSEHGITLVDSRGAMTALGESGTHRLNLRGGGGGTYAVDDASGWLRITHVNFTESGDNETIYNASLGSVTYENGDTTVAYEGGGVWRTRDSGSTMVSPPEFHYRDATLTLPVIQVDGSGGASGHASVRVSPGETHEQVFPNTTADPTMGTEIGAPYDGTNDSYVNPVENGSIHVSVHSAHYQGWAEYFRTRTDGNVWVDHDRRVATVELQTLALAGAFEMPAEGNSINVRGMDTGHNVSNYTLSLQADNHFNNMHWSMYHESPTEEFEFHIHSDGKCSGGSYNGELDVSVYYWDGGTRYEGWQNSSIDPGGAGSGEDFVVDCTQDPAVLHANLTGQTPLTYGEIDGVSATDNKWHFGSEIDNRDVEDVTLDDHAADNSRSFEVGASDDAEIDFVVNHYFSLIAPDFELTVSDGPGTSERVDESASSGQLDYETIEGARYITFLHVTENEIEVRVE